LLTNWSWKLLNKFNESVVLIMDHLTYAEAILEISRQKREGEITEDLAKKLLTFCEQLHMLWKEKVSK